MAFDIEYDSKDDDYRMVVIRLRDGGLSHRCGYVYVPRDHPFANKDYDFQIPCDIQKVKINASDPIGTMCAAFDAQKGSETLSISYLANVHGGITFAGGDKRYPIKELDGRWCFGFDAAHCDDSRHNGGQPLDYMIAECEKLRDFLKHHSADKKQAA